MTTRERTNDGNKFRMVHTHTLIYTYVYVFVDVYCISAPICNIYQCAYQRRPIVCACDRWMRNQMGIDEIIIYYRVYRVDRNDKNNNIIKYIITILLLLLLTQVRSRIDNIIEPRAILSRLRVCPFAALYTSQRTDVTDLYQPTGNATLCSENIIT